MWPGVTYIQCGTVITRSFFFQKYSRKAPHSSPVGARYGVSFVGSAPEWYSASVPAMIYAICWYIGPRYNGTRLYSSAIRAMCHALLWIQVAPKSWMNHVTLNLRIPTNQACSSVPNHRGHLTTHPTIRNCTFAFRWVWWRHNMDTIFIPLALCEGNPSVTCGFPTQMGSCEELCY